MKFLVDHQLPPALTKFLGTLGHESRHVREIGLKSDDDLTIGRFATSNGFVLISKDQDFLDLASRPHEKGRLIWVRLGNCRNQPLLQAFGKFMPQIFQSFDEGGRVIEIR